MLDVSSPNIESFYFRPSELLTFLPRPLKSGPALTFSSISAYKRFCLSGDYNCLWVNTNFWFLPDLFIFDLGPFAIFICLKLRFAS